MAAEEDKKFDAVLGGFLVNDLRARAGNLHCPESDVLAAYHERSLLPEEMSSWKKHIAGCARCQAVLAGLEASEAIPLRASEDASREEAAPLAKSAEPASVAREEHNREKFPEKSRIRAISPGARWRWLAPAGALAAGLLVWVAWHEKQPWPSKRPATVKTATLEPAQPAPQPLPPQQAEASPSLSQGQTDQSARLLKDQGTAGRAPSAEPTRPSDALHSLEKPHARVSPAAVGLSADKERVRRENVASDLEATKPAPSQLAQEGKPGLAAAAQTVLVQKEAANPQIAGGQLSVQTSAEATPLAPAEAANKSKADSRTVLRPATTAPPPPAFSDFNRSPAALAVRASDLHRIATPNPKTLWRAGRAGMIEFSSDGGASWSRQTSNALADLTAGSAPSETVCWIVGRAGTILLTSDAGSHWVVLDSPLDEDLGGVRARDALHATVWNLGNTKVFETADGGVTWKPAASP